MIKLTHALNASTQKQDPALNSKITRPWAGLSIQIILLITRKYEYFQIAICKNLQG